MHGDRKSDRLVVPEKLPNKAGVPAAEAVEGRGLGEGNAASTTRLGHGAGMGVPSGLDRVRRVAKQDKEVRFTALLHHVDVDRLRAAYWALEPRAAPGVDGVTWWDYGQDLEENLRDLHARVHRGAYRARPSRRVYIPKADGRQRPLGVAALEDKLLQRAVVEVLNAIYEADFLGFSYGFRPRRSQHQALDALSFGMLRKKVSWVLDADIRGFYDAIDHGWMLKFLEHRIADRRILRLICKWLKAGVIENGEWSETLEGTAQGASVSPLLSNVYLHYVFDLWAEQWRRRHARGDVVIVRFADDYIVGFQHEGDARRFLAELRGRLAEFCLELALEKTRLIEFGRFAAERRAKRGLGKPETFQFLGFTHVCAKTERAVQAQAHHRREADAREAAQAQRRVQATHASADPRAGALARQRPARALQLLRSARQHRGGPGIPGPGNAALVCGASAPQPTQPSDLGADAPPRATMAPASQDHAPLACRSIRRSYPS
jgi:RNA-directed DNA polymerase